MINNIRCFRLSMAIVLRIHENLFCLGNLLMKNRILCAYIFFLGIKVLFKNIYLQSEHCIYRIESNSISTFH